MEEERLSPLDFRNFSVEVEMDDLKFESWAERTVSSRFGIGLVEELQRVFRIKSKQNSRGTTGM